MTFRGKVRTLAVSGAALFALAGPSSASAVTVGETFVPSLNCAVNTTFLQTGSPDDQYIVPFAGRITSWSYQAPADPPDVKLKVGRFAGGTDYTIVGDSALENPAPNTFNTYPANFRVARGDIVGIYISQSKDCARFDSDFTDVFFPADVAPGTTETFIPESHAQFNVAAELDPFRCANRNATHAGTPGDDSLTGTPGDDVIVGLGGDDLIAGVGGDDCLSGGDGNDDARGGGGEDKVKGGAGKDKVKGNAAKDKVNGGGGKDKVIGSAAKDRVKGGGGKDKVIGGSGKDKMKGGAGNDKMKANDGRRDVVNCGSGNDVADVDPEDAVRGNCETVRVVDGG